MCICSYKDNAKLLLCNWQKCKWLRIGFSIHLLKSMYCFWLIYILNLEFKLYLRCLAWRTVKHVNILIKCLQSTHLKFYKNRCIITTKTVSLSFLSDYFLLCPPHIVTILLLSAGPWKTWRPSSQVQVTPCIFAWLTIMAAPVHLSITTTWALEQGWSLRTVDFYWRSVWLKEDLCCVFVNLWESDAFMLTVNIVKRCAFLSAFFICL